MGHGSFVLIGSVQFRLNLSQSVLRYSITDGHRCAGLSPIGTDRISAEYAAAPNEDLRKSMDEILREEEGRE